MKILAAVAAFICILKVGYADDLYSPVLYFPDTIYDSEHFSLDWGGTVRISSDENIKGSIYLSRDKVFDSDDVFVTSGTNSISPEVGYFNSRINNVTLSSSEDYPFGIYYLILVLDPNNSIEEDYETNNTRPFEVRLFTREADISIQQSSASKVKNDSTLVLTQSFFNTGEIPVTELNYSVKISNTSSTDSVLLYSTTEHLEGITTDVDSRTTKLHIDITGMEFNPEKFSVLWSIETFAPSDADFNNNVVFKTYSWDDLEDEEPELTTVYMNDRNDTVVSCNAVIYDDGGPSERYSHNINSSIQLVPSLENSIIKLLSSE
jgi:hypothetical protein